MIDKDVNLEVMSGFTTDKRMIVDNTNYVYKDEALNKSVIDRISKKYYE